MRPVLLLAVLLLAVLPATPPAAASTLLADAGTSRFLTSEPTVAATGRAAGGQAPYAYSWSYLGDAGRFADPTAAETTFDLAGLSGDIVLTLTVTDALGATATDAVKHRASPEQVLLDVTRFVPGGALLLSFRHPFTVPSGVPRLVATLDWGNGLNDLDFELFAPGGASATGTTAQTGAKPERATVPSPAAGAWDAAVYPFLSGPDTYHLRVVAPSEPSPLPVVSGRGPWAFGALDLQSMDAAAAFGTPPYSFSWDLDGDRLAETAGQTVIASLPPGEHDLWARVADAAGYEVEAPVHVTVGTAERVLRFQCAADPRAIVPMEFTSTKNTCWIHGGHHTYFTGSAAWELRRLHGFVFSVEQQLAWPQEFVEGDPTRAPVVFETSLNGREFATAGSATYTLLSTSPLGLEERQGIWFGFEATGGGEFRYLRARNPLSLTQGLSGYLDNTLLFAHVDSVAAGPAPATAPGTRALGCAQGDVLEDFFAEHPCWFGGLDRYDAPSFWHTYPLGEGAVLEAVSGNFTLAPWRTDDWNQGRPAAQASNVTAQVQLSVDGVTWRTAATVAATFGVRQAFQVELGGEGARFLRLFPEYHARYDQTRDFAPNHHPRGYFLASAVEVAGVLPTA